jgi:hypothetical protein
LRVLVGQLFPALLEDITPGAMLWSGFYATSIKVFIVNGLALLHALKFGCLGHVPLCRKSTTQVVSKGLFIVMVSEFMSIHPT